ncbi:hypothetical protein AU15_00150 [Marinobacter salarius]|uniref:Uncharacterized protein n=1 Tax=Marinobacter salarius TaxID=1420917 RepID=W5YVS6_9GAMM|nr:hypothetical protein AU15_00150 [Marinobacter salarius]
MPDGAGTNSIERQVGLRELALEALVVRENEGRGAAWRFLKEQGKSLDLHLLLIDADRNDGDLPSSIRERMKSGGWHRQKPAVIEVGEDHRLVAWPRLDGEAGLIPSCSVSWNWGWRSSSSRSPVGGLRAWCPAP